MATANNPLLQASPEQLALLSRDLLATAERLEAGNTDSAINPDWYAVTRAAALIDGIRHGLVEVGHG